jgi:threonylcarbamoyladenosine tRNA methylthiotransferase MtaB
MNICFDTFGCRLNRAEALEDEARSIAKGHRVVDSHAEADLVVVRGCSVTARAQHDCEQAIRHLRDKYPGKRVIVTGCLPDAKKLDISSLAKSGRDLPSVEPVPKRTARAYLKVQDGCSCNCSFCIVPKFRGAPVSVPFAEVIGKARRFVSAGYHEIVVTGCNLALYSSEGRRLPDLAAALAEVSPDCRVRLGSVEPGPMAMDLVHAMAEHGNICRFLHISAQSGSNVVLEAMKRPYKVKDIDDVAGEATALMPNIGLGCDLIAGFPGETENDFRMTKGLLLRHPFSNVHAFPFSERPGTPAAAILSGRTTKDIRRARARELAGIGDEARRRIARRFVGKTVEVVVENDHPVSGWTGEYLWLEAMRRSSGFGAVVSRNSLRKQKVEFRVRSSENGVLYGEPVRNGR